MEVIVNRTSNTKNEGVCEFIYAKHINTVMRGPDGYTRNNINDDHKSYNK